MVILLFAGNILSHFTFNLIQLIRMLTAKAREQEDTILDYMDKDSTFKKLENEHQNLAHVRIDFLVVTI